MDLSHDIMKKIGEDIQIRRNYSALLGELTDAIEDSESQEYDFFDYFASECWIDWAGNGWTIIDSREECPCADHMCARYDANTETQQEMFRRLCQGGAPLQAHSRHDKPLFCSWTEVFGLRAKGKLAIVQEE
mgnify:CR=1 FL=1